MVDFFKRTKQESAKPASRSICVWGPAGSTGKTTIAVNLACELALEGNRVMLIDLDTYSPSISDALGLVDHPPGLASAARLVGQGRFELEQIDRLSVRFEVGSGQLAVLTGLSNASRWPEISGEKIEGLISVGLENFDFVVVDVSPHLEPAVRQVGGAIDRNIATRAALQSCSVSLAVVAADPLGVKRFVEVFEQAAGISKVLIIVANRLRASALGLKARRQVEDALKFFCNREIAAFIPEDAASCDRSLFEMVPLAMMKRASPARQAIAQFARLTFLPGHTRKGRRVAKLD